jgi:ABC-2 type transport system permease protein
VVERLLRLKLRLLVASLRRSPAQVVGLVLALVYALGTIVLVVAGLIALRFLPVDTAATAVVVFGSIVVLLYTLLPLVLGIDDLLDPRSFALFGISTGRLSASLAVASIVGVPGLVITVIALATVTTWTRSPGGALLALVGAALVIVTCLLSSRIATSVAAFLLSSRRARDIAGLLGVLVLVALAPLVAALANVDWRTSALDVLGSIADVAGWTPLGAAWSVPAEAAAGDAAAAVGKLVLALGWVGILALAWRALVGVMLVTPIRQASPRRYAGLGWFDRLPATPVGAIAARSLTYWLRDARYGVSLVVIPIIPIIMVVTLHIAGLPLDALALLPVPIACLFLSWTIHNDVAFDNTAIWLHLAASTRGRDDRWGRVLPVLFVGAPVVVVGSILSAWAFGDWAVLPSLIGVSACVLLTGLGLSSIMSAAFPYPAVRPGESPFSQPNGGGSPAGLIQALSFLVIVVLSAPAVVLAALGLTLQPSWHVWSFLVGVGVGVLVLVFGARVGAGVFDRRGPLLLEAATRN